ncbi:zinc finger domain-containing protein [Streptomyces rochei]
MRSRLNWCSHANASTKVSSSLPAASSVSDGFGRYSETIGKAQPPRQRRSEREPQETAGSAARTWHAKDVTCPKCQARPNSPCTPQGPHQERVEWVKEFTRKVWG